MRILLERVTAGYGDRVALREVELEVREGELLSVVGPNGAGKTTLLRVIAGILRPQRGKVYVDGRPASRLSPREISKRIGAVAQDPGTNFDFTVEELVELGRLPYLSFPDRLGPRDREAVERALRLVGLSTLRKRRLSTLSGGERRKAFIAAALAREPEVLLLDEPTAHLDIKAQVELIQLFRDWAGEGITVIATAHDLNLAATFPRVLLLAKGELLADGNPQAVFTPENVRLAFDVEADIGIDTRTGEVTIRYLLPGNGYQRGRDGGMDGDLRHALGEKPDIFGAER
jgi:iron complex transport system ATP-binding protein